MTPELQLKVQDWRRKARDGSITTEELKEALLTLREGRIAAGAASTKSRAKKAEAAKPLDTDSLFAEFE